MAKMSKILVIFILLGVFILFPAVAQNAAWTKADLQIVYMEQLREEGYVPYVDTDGDIEFKVSGDTYFIIVDDKDIEFFQIYRGFSLGSITRNEALDIANESNRISKVAKVSISSPESERLIISITAELLVEEPKGFIPVFNRAISLIRNAENNFKRQLGAH